jgi:amino acid transporter
LVKRGLGPFWGFQEAWLSIAYSVVDIAIYPTLFVTYLAQLFPSLGGDARGQPGWWLAMGGIAASTAWNMSEIRSIGRGSVALGAAALAPFVAIVVLAAAAVARGGLSASTATFRDPGASDGGAIAGGLLMAMWNLMGFDSATTFAAEVRDPGRSYPRAVILAALAIGASYVITIAVSTAAGLAPAEWASGSWVRVGARLGGPALGAAVTAGGAVSAFGMYNALCCPGLAFR